MNYIISFANNPDLLSRKQMGELRTSLVRAVKHKISKLENKYNIKLKFPKNTCNTEENEKSELSTISTPIIVTPSVLTLYAPIDIILGDFTNNEDNDEDNIDKLSSCMKIVNSVKREFEEFESGNKKKEDIDNTFFDWIEPKDDSDKNNVYSSEIEEMYEKKFGNKAVLDELIKRLKSMQKL